MKQEKHNKRIFNLISIGLAVILSGLSYFIKDNSNYSIALLIIGVTIIFLTLFVNFILPVIIARINLYKDPKIFFNSKQTGAWAEEVYRLAKNEGGEIFATHIYQHRKPANKDFAVNQLKDEIKNGLKFNRIIIFDNQKDEIEWIENLFSLNNPNLKIAAYFWKYVNLSINRFTIGLIPRINILLYKNEKGTKYRTLIGLEKVRSASDVDEANLNLGICSSKKPIFDLLMKYYENIQKHPEIESASNTETYRIKKSEFPISPSEQGLLKELISFSHKEENILHLGAFGHTALTLNNICNIKRNLNHYSDVDVLLVTNENVEIIKKKLEILLNSDKIEFVFGFNDKYFYNFRNPKKTTIDIEIFEQHSNFYDINKLLGYSIFSNYYTMYSFEHKTLAELLSIPQKSITKEERADLIVNDRKGINDFIKNLKNNNDNTIDPRRVLTHNIKNFNWFLTGFRTYDIESSIEFMSKHSFLDKGQVNFVQNTLGMSDNNIKRNYNRIIADTLDILENIKFKIK